MESAKRLGLEVVSYGDGKPWPRSFGKAGIVDQLEFLKGRTEDVVLYTDSSDAFIANPNILEGWAAAGSPDILLQAEKNCYPDPEAALVYPESPTPFKYICTGGLMGNRKAIVQALEEIMWGGQFARDSYCVQRLWTDWYLRFPGAQQRAKIDHYCHVFQAMYLTHEMRETGRNCLTGTYPSVWHFNGKTSGMREWYELLTQK